MGPQAASSSDACGARHPEEVGLGGEREDEWEKELLLLYPLDRIPRHPQAIITLNIFGWTLTYMGHKSLTLMYVCMRTVI